MRHLNSPNKMLPLTSDTKVKFNVGMHGIGAGQIVRYNAVSSNAQMLIRRRLADDDGSVEVVKNEEAPRKPTPSPKPKKDPAKSDSKSAAAGNSNEGDK